MKKLKSLFLTIISSLLLLVSCIKTTNKTSIEEVNYNNQPKSAFRYILDDSVNSLDGKLDGGFGGGAGLTIAAVVGAFISGGTGNSTSTINIGSNGFTISGGSKTTPSNLSLGGVVENIQI